MKHQEYPQWELEIFEKSGVFDLVNKRDELSKTIQSRNNFLEKVDDRSQDPDYTLEQQHTEDKKYERYQNEVEEQSTELAKLRGEILSKIKEKFPEYNEVFV